VTDRGAGPAEAGPPDPRLYLGFDSSTQSLSAIVIEVDGTDARLRLELTLPFDETLPEYGTRHGVLPHADPSVAVSSPVMWAEALDVMMARLAASGLDLQRIAAISGSAQQHGSVYLNAAAEHGLAAFDHQRPLAAQVPALLARPVAPIWMDSSSAAACAAITDAVGGAGPLAQRTGSRAFERFTGPQIRTFALADAAGYAATDRIHLVSSYLASLLIGAHAPVDRGDASGANLMDLRDGRWWPLAVDATAPGLARKLPPIAPSTMVAGRLSPYWQRRYGLPPTRVVVWSGDNPCSLVGVGLVREGRVAISLGTSDTVFGLMTEPRVDPGGTGHVFAAPTGDFMGLTCFSNGSLARERVRDEYGLTWADVSRILETTAAGNAGRLLIPWFAPEITPPVARPGVRRYRLAASDAPANVRGVIEAQQLAMRLHSRWMNVAIDAIYATGGAAVNTPILQVMADVFGAPVYRSSVGNSAALGAALRAGHADRAASGQPVSWDDATRHLAQPDRNDRIVPDARHHAVYQDVLPIYAACEAHALGHGEDPTERLRVFAER
jgi:xylulokinase